MTVPTPAKAGSPRRSAGEAPLSRPAGVALFVAAVVLPLLRQPGARSWETIWIEDAPIYVQQANAGSVWSTVFDSYAGYLQLIVRLLALPTAVIPVSWLAAYLAVASAFVCALGAAFVYRSTQGWIATQPFRLIVAGMVVLGPTLAIETTATITNVIWTVLAVAPWAFISMREGRKDVVLRSLMAFVAATATVLSALFLPLAIGVAIVRRTRASIVVAAVFTAGLLLQLSVVVRTKAEHGASSPRLIADFYGLRVLGNLLIGERPLDQLWTGIGEPVVIVFVLLTIGLFAVLLRGAGRRNQRMALVMIAYSVVALVVPVWGRGTENIRFDIGVYSWNMTRYLGAPILLLVSAVALLVDPVGRERRRRVAEVGRKVFLVQTAILVIIGFVTPTVRSDGPTWIAESTHVYESECVGQPPDKVVEVTTTPSNFRLALRCDRLRS